MTETRSQRLRRVEATLQAGKIPKILRPLPGVEPLLRKYGLEPGVDVFVPQPGMTQAECSRARANLRYRRDYRRHRAAISASYVSQEDQRKRAADKILRELGRKKNA